MERAVVLVDGRRSTPTTCCRGSNRRPRTARTPGSRARIERSEIDAIRRALESADWNVTQAAAGLGIDRTNLHRKMRKYGIERRG